ncbi:hypothetical protein [Geodermatophilus sp. URMC 63]
MARARISSTPYRGVQPQCAGCSSRTTAPGRTGCCPTVLPTGPENTPDWMPETRSGGWSSGHHSGASSGRYSRRQESRTSWWAAVAARGLHCGR